MTLSSHPRQTVGREPSLDERHNSRTVGRCGHSVDTRGSRDSPMGSRALYQSHRTHTRNRHRTLGRSDRAHPAPQLTTSRTNRTQAALPPSPFSYRLPSMTCDILLSPPTLRESGTIIGIAYITADVHALVGVCAGTDRLKAGIPGPPADRRTGPRTLIPRAARPRSSDRPTGGRLRPEHPVSTPLVGRGVRGTHGRAIRDGRGPVAGRVGHLEARETTGRCRPLDATAGRRGRLSG